MNSIVVIDDDLVDCLINTKILKYGNFAKKVVEYHSGVSALTYLSEIINDAEQWPDYIFLDINMPIMNGFEFIDAYCKLPEASGRKTKIIMLSSSINPADKEKAKQYDIISSFLIKPLTVEKAEKIFQDN